MIPSWAMLGMIPLAVLVATTVCLAATTMISSMVAMARIRLMVGPVTTSLWVAMGLIASSVEMEVIR